MKKVILKTFMTFMIFASAKVAVIILDTTEIISPGTISIVVVVLSSIIIRMWFTELKSFFKKST